MSEPETGLIKLLTVHEFAEGVRKTPETIRIWYRLGLIKGIPMGRTVLYPLDELLRLQREGIPERTPKNMRKKSGPKPRKAAPPPQEAQE